jgi:hypothetical protein
MYKHSNVISRYYTGNGANISRFLWLYCLEVEIWF